MTVDFKQVTESARETLRQHRLNPKVLVPERVLRHLITIADKYHRLLDEQGPKNSKR